MRFPRIYVFLAIHHDEISKPSVLLPYPPIGYEAFRPTQDESKVRPKGRNICRPIGLVARLIPEEFTTLSFISCREDAEKEEEWSGGGGGVDVLGRASYEVRLVWVRR